MRHSKRLRSFVFLSALFLAPALCLAQSAVTAPEGPQKFVQDLGNSAIAVIANTSLSPEQHQTQYDQILRNAFDLATIGKFVLGNAWRTATPEQQQQYMKLFEQTIIKIYGSRLNFYNGESFHVKGGHAESDKDFIVNSEIDHNGGGSPTSVDWRVRQTDGKFLIVDVVVEGVSQSVTQRQEYASILQRNNGDLNALLAMMEKHLQDAPSGQAGTQ